MSPPATGTSPGPDHLFVIACPVCRGHVAASGRLGGRGACCPLCANLFRVPLPAPATASQQGPAAAGPALAEDWEAVIEQLAPPPQNAVAPPDEEPPPPVEFPPAAEMAGAVSLPPESEAEATPAGLLADAPPAAPPSRDGAEPPATAAITPAGESLLFPQPEETAPAIALGLEDAAPPAPPVDTGALPRTEPAAVAASASELVFHEPVRTIRQRGTVIEIRRLTPEERRVRRFRRNLMMIVVGVSILMVIVLLFGVPQAPRK